MRLRLTIDNVTSEIDSTDPELLGKWVAEIFARLPMVYPSTYIAVQAMPSWAVDGNADWIADSRIIGQQVQIRSPRELVEALGKQLDQLEALDGRL